MHVAARPAAVDEVATIDALAFEAVAEQAGGRGGVVWSSREALRQPRGEALAAAIADRDQLVLVGTIDDDVVGYATTELETIVGGSLLGVITSVFVLPGARGVGVGEAMLDAVVAWCESRRCSGIDAHALPGNRETKNFFETFGFTARLLVVHRAL